MVLCPCQRQCVRYEAYSKIHLLQHLQVELKPSTYRWRLSSLNIVEGYTCGLDPVSDILAVLWQGWVRPRHCECQLSRHHNCFNPFNLKHTPKSFHRPWVYCIGILNIKSLSQLRLCHVTSCGAYALITTPTTIFKGDFIYHRQRNITSLFITLHVHCWV